jgi:Peptidase S24-like
MASDLELLALRELPEVRGLLLASGVMRLRIASDSMRPTLRPGDEIAVQPEAIAALRPGDLIVYQVGGDLVCHRVVRSSADTVWTRAETADSADDRIAWDQVLGRVVEVRKRGLWVGVKVLLRGALSPPVHRWLRRLQGLDAYRALSAWPEAPSATSGSSSPNMTEFLFYPRPRVRTCSSESGERPPPGGACWSFATRRGGARVYMYDSVIAGWASNRS